MSEWVKYKGSEEKQDWYLAEPLYLGNGLTGPTGYKLHGEDEFGLPIDFSVGVDEIIPIATGLIALIKGLFTATPEEKQARREWREYRRDQRHRRRIERIEARKRL